MLRRSFVYAYNPAAINIDFWRIAVVNIAHRSLVWLSAFCMVCGLAACSAAGTEVAKATPSIAFVPQVTIFAPTATATEIPTPTLAPVTLTPLPTALAQNTDPFTGLPITDTNTLSRRPVLVKVANTSEVRPQSGLSQADVVVEHYAEGGITRLTALFLAHTLERVGSVRSCRLIDLELAPIFGASLTCSGTSNGVREFLLASRFIFPTGVTDAGIGFVSDLGPYECDTCPMFRVDDRPMPHNLFANTVNIWAELTKRGLNQPTQFKSWTFEASAPNSGKAVSKLSLPYLSGDVEWTYDNVKGSWLRSINGEAHKDADTNSALQASNVLVIFAQHEYTPIIEDSNGSRSIRIWLWGKGQARLYRDGRVYTGTWERPQDSTYIFRTFAQRASQAGTCGQRSSARK